MWIERFVIVITSLHRDFLPSSWGMYRGTMWDWMTFFGTIGLFLSLLFLFIRFLPMISIFEMRTIVPGTKGSEMTEVPAMSAQTHPQSQRPLLHGLMAEFNSASDLIAAAHQVHDRRLHAGGRPTRPIRSRRSPRRWAITAPSCRSSC